MQGPAEKFPTITQLEITEERLNRIESKLHQMEKALNIVILEMEKEQPVK